MGGRMRTRKIHSMYNMRVVLIKGDLLRASMMITSLALASKLRYNTND